MARPGFDDPQWYRRAVFYEVFLRGFADSSGDGSGDLRGLTERLDHLDWLGVDCVWLLPFYASPLRDGGYDISDFFTVHPTYGVLADVIELVDEAHKRGIRVVADLVMNHTSDQHPWFQESRQDRTNPKADWYVWGDDDQRWSEARIIFHDTERSNWTWDPQREQYFWHRFFSHQPDLNYRNEEVCEAIIDMVRYWARHRARRLPARRRAVPLRGRRDQRREPGRDPRLPAATADGARRQPSRHGCCWPRPTSGRATCSPTSVAATSATCASTSRSCPACTWPPSAASGARSRPSSPRRLSCPTVASGASSCATTTS